MIDVLYTHALARRTGRPPYFYSRFRFEPMRERGNTHVCFYCLARYGFKPGPNGEITNLAPGDHMNEHTEAHAPGVVGNADKYTSPREWLNHELPDDFPLTVTIPNIS